VLKKRVYSLEEG